MSWFVWQLYINFGCIYLFIHITSMSSVITEQAIEEESRKKMKIIVGAITAVITIVESMKKMKIIVDAITAVITIVLA